MENTEYQKMFELETKHWWFQGRLRMIEAVLQQSVFPQIKSQSPNLLDLGCGTGLFLERNQARFQSLFHNSLCVGLDFSSQALSYCQKRGSRYLVQGDAVELPFQQNSFDIILSLDMIEHIREDHRAVEEIFRILKPGGILLATVPAHPFLWTGHDVWLHHFRRYTRSTFSDLFPEHQWKNLRMTPYFSIVFPLVATIRIGRRLLRQDTIGSDTQDIPWYNQWMIHCHQLEAHWLRKWNLPLGISWLTVRQKN